MLRLNVKLSEVLLLRLHAAFHTLPLFNLRTKILRTCASKNYATMEISTYRRSTPYCGSTSTLSGETQCKADFSLVRFLIESTISSNSQK